MGLVDLKTDLKSLKYGNDRFGGGSSNQPYITKGIPDDLPPSSPDFLLRNGFLNPVSSATDVIRLTKYFADLKSPSGLLFTAKQEMLSRSGVKTVASKGLFNEGVYNPLNTVLQAGLVSTGGHLNKQGLNPFAGMGGLGILSNIGGVPNYGDYFRQPGTLERSPLRGTYRRLFNDGATDIPGTADKNAKNIDQYQGGPGSILGIGNTTINLATDNTGAPLRTGLPFVQTRNQGFVSGSLVVIKDKSDTTNSPLKLALGLSYLYGNLPSVKALTSPKFITNPTNGITNTNIFALTTTKPGTTLVSNPPAIQKQDTYTYDQELLTAQSSSYQTKQPIQDFRKAIRSKFSGSSGFSGTMAAAQAPDYTTQNIENRVHLGDPGRAGRNLSSYTKGNGPLDKITALELYRSEWVTQDTTKNDLVKFRIAAIDSDTPNFKVFMHFRAFLDSFQDQYGAEWGETKYIGRGEKFFNYNGFSRTISMGWTVFAQSKEELIPMYKKLNYLASNLAPDYSKNGYMRGPLVQMTVGGYLYEMPGFMTSLNYDIPAESPWEIGINDTNGGDDTSVKELPHMIKVTCQFTPIHESVPRKNPLYFANNNNNKNVPIGHDPEWVKHGNSRFIALSNVGHAVKGAIEFDTAQLIAETDQYGNVLKDAQGKILTRERKFSNYNSVNTDV
jgi:hypothetical protein